MPLGGKRGAVVGDGARLGDGLRGGSGKRRWAVGAEGLPRIAKVAALAVHHEVNHAAAGVGVDGKENGVAVLAPWQSRSCPRPRGA